ncbi:MAG: hypothetical protein JWR89_1583, partial [Tardiphaga sp.]|nr:hypothetical protein [Tardiphaga sp.]
MIRARHSMFNTIILLTGPAEHSIFT